MLSEWGSEFSTNCIDFPTWKPCECLVYSPLSLRETDGSNLLVNINKNPRASQEDFHSSCSQMNDARGQVGSCFFFSERSAARRNAIVNFRLLMSALTSTQHTWSNVSSLMGQGPHPLPPTVVGNTRSKSSWCPGEELAWCLSTYQSIPVIKVIKVFEDTGSKLSLKNCPVSMAGPCHWSAVGHLPRLEAIFSQFVENYIMWERIKRFTKVNTNIIYCFPSVNQAHLLRSVTG